MSVASGPGSRNKCAPAYAARPRDLVVSVTARFSDGNDSFRSDYRLPESEIYDALHAIAVSDDPVFPGTDAGVAAAIAVKREHVKQVLARSVAEAADKLLRRNDTRNGYRVFNDNGDRI